MVNALVLLETQVVVVGAGVADSVYVWLWVTARAVVAGVIAEAAVGVVGDDVSLEQALTARAVTNMMDAKNRLMKSVGKSAGLS
jgi:predicted transcriptional regulator